MGGFVAYGLFFKVLAPAAATGATTVMGPALLVGGVVLIPFAAVVGAALEFVGVSGLPADGAVPYGGIMDAAAGSDELLA